MSKFTETLWVFVVVLYALYWLVVMYPFMKEGMRELVQDVRTVHSD